MDSIVLSTLEHTWIIDLDGTIVKHNSYKTDEKDFFLPGAKDFLMSIPEKDMIIFLTSRQEMYKEITETFLNDNGIKYQHIIFNVPYGERILINDDKPSGLKTAVAINGSRNDLKFPTIVENPNL